MIRLPPHKNTSGERVFPLAPPSITPLGESINLFILHNTFIKLINGVGNLSSMAPMSLAKRLRIRPDKMLVSKHIQFNDWIN